MKKILLTISLCFSLAQSWAADSIKFAEVLRDVNECYRDEGETYCDVYQRNSGRFTARLTVPGLSTAMFTEETSIYARLGNLELGGYFGEAASFNANRVVFRLFEEYEVETRDGDFITRFRRVGTITMSRSGDTLTINASFSRLPQSIVADSFSWDENGNGQTLFELSINEGELLAAKNVEFKARVVERPSRDPESEPLRTILIAGRADYTPPTVKITLPRNQASVPGEVVTFQGTAQDNVGVAEVQYRVGEDDWATAEGTTAWSAEVALAPGSNIVQVRSLDFEGLESKVVTRTVLSPGPAVP